MSATNTLNDLEQDILRVQKFVNKITECLSGETLDPHATVNAAWSFLPPLQESLTKVTHKARDMQSLLHADDISPEPQQTYDQILAALVVELSHADLGQLSNLEYILAVAQKYPISVGAVKDAAAFVQRAFVDQATMPDEVIEQLQQGVTM